MAGLIVAAVTSCWQIVVAWLKWLFPSKTKGDFVETILIPIASPAVIGVGIWFLDRNAKARENQREDNENKSQALQLFFERISAILLDKRVIYLAEAADSLKTSYRDPIVESARAAIRAQTLGILRILSADVEKKSAVIRFLIESEIIDKLKVSLMDAELGNASLEGAVLNDVDFQYAQLSGAKLRGVRLINAKLNHANLIKADLSYSNLIGANFNHADLKGVDLVDAVLTSPRTSLYRAKLSGADLSYATICQANLGEAKLIEAKLIGADLTGAKLAWADLTKAKLMEAKLRDTDLHGANLDNILWNEKTEWPDRENFVHARHIPEALKKQLEL